jgi:phosphonate transport system ATP-binding protein
MSVLRAVSTAPGDQAIVLQGVSKRYGPNAGVFDVSLAVRPGDFVALLGPSGAGKSTLFRCVTGLVRADAGRVEVLGADMGRLRGLQLREARRAIGLIFQQFNLIGRSSALANVLAGRLGHVSTLRAALRCFEPTDRQRALAALDRVGLLEKAYQRADSLSGGQQQRVAIARVLAQESRVVLADEPVSSLDPDSAHNVLTILRSIARERGIAVLSSLHQVAYAQEYADRIVGLREGHVCVDVPAKDFGDRDMAEIYGEVVVARAARLRG